MTAIGLLVLGAIALVLLALLVDHLIGDTDD